MLSPKTLVGGGGLRAPWETVSLTPLDQESKLAAYDRLYSFLSSFTATLLVGSQ